LDCLGKASSQSFETGTKLVRKLIIIYLALLGINIFSCNSQDDPSAASSTPLSQAHAHNDYLHKNPLFDALNNGFISVEVDVHLFRGKNILNGMEI
jgi:hypothetical protein